MNKSSKSRSSTKNRKDRKTQQRNRPVNQFEELDEKKEVNLALGRLSPGKLAQYIAHVTERFEKNATLVELQDHSVTGK